jgi:glycosyltransferase involved in cell wall biosynthesis
LQNEPNSDARRVLYIQYTNPAGYPPLQHSSRILAEAGWHVLFLGTGALGSNALEFPAQPNITVRRMLFRREGWRQKLHYLRFSFWVLRTIVSFRPEWVYASDPLACPIALLLIWIPGLKVTYHEHDSPNAAPSGWFQTAVLNARRSLAKRANFCILPNEQRLTRFASDCGPLRDAVCVWNCPSSTEAASQPKGPVERPIRVLYHGSIVPDRLPLAVLDGLALLPDSVHLRVAGYETVGSRGYIAQMRQRAKESGLEHRVEFLGTIPQRADLLRIAQESDIGLALMPPATTDWNCQTMTGASNKAFDYLAFGLALVVSDLPDWREMFAEPGYGLACDPQDPRSLAAAIGWLVEHPSEMRTMGERGRQKIFSDWNYETTFAPVLHRMSRQLEQTISAKQPLESPAAEREL